MKGKNDINLEKIKIENRSMLKLTSVIISSILGVVALIGVFWGKEGLIFVGLSIFVLVLLTIWVVVGTN